MFKHLFQLFNCFRVTPFGLPVETKVHCSVDVIDSIVVIGTLIEDSTYHIILSATAGAAYNGHTYKLCQTDFRRVANRGQL